ncbi:hypothetical protein HHI36_004864, partial [Cryptolaemus montrouzieri]
TQYFLSRVINCTASFVPNRMWKINESGKERIVKLYPGATMNNEQPTMASVYGSHQSNIASTHSNTPTITISTSKSKSYTAVAQSHLFPKKDEGIISEAKDGMQLS